MLSLDLAGFTVNADSIFGLGDLQDIAFYRLELLDGSMTLLPLTGLPKKTRYIRVRSNSTAVQSTEGIQIYFGGTASAVPVPAAAWLFGSGLGALALARRKRRAG